MATSHRVISADAHVVEPPDLWTEWLEAKYRDTAPKLVEDKDGGHAWLYLGATTPEPLGLVTCVGTRPEELRWTGARYGASDCPGVREIHPGCYRGPQRLELMDEDGVDVEILYPPQRAMLTFMKQADREAHLAGIRAYNRWLKEGFCAADPTRLVGIFQMPNVGIETAVAELERAKKEGYKGVALSAWPSGGDSLRPDDDPFWDAASRLDMPVSIHLLLSAQQTKMTASSKGSVAIGASAFMYTMPTLIELIFQGVFDRFPDLRVAFVEVGVGWIPHFLEMVDDRYWRNRHWTNTKVKKVPSQYFKDHCLATFMTDMSGVAIRHLVGVENMAWSTDFPHHGNDWPYSRKTIETLFVNVPEDERRKIVHDNAARFWSL